MDIYISGSHGELNDSPDRSFEFAGDLCCEQTKTLVLREATTLGGALVGVDVEVVFNALNGDI